MVRNGFNIFVDTLTCSFGTVLFVKVSNLNLHKAMNFLWIHLVVLNVSHQASLGVSRPRICAIYRLFATGRAKSIFELLACGLFLFGGRRYE
jgi:hypothetical protein